MHALLPVFCRPMGYLVMAIALFLPFLMMMMGKVTDANLLFYKECSKLLMMMGAVMILFAYQKREDAETLRLRNAATRNAIFLTVAFVTAHMFYKVLTGDIASLDTSSFLIFLVINVLCLEFAIKKAETDRLFKK